MELPERLQQYLSALAEQLDADTSDEQASAEILQHIQSEVGEQLASDELTDQEKAQLIEAVQNAITDLQHHAQSQRQSIDEGLKKLSKGRKSVSRYKQVQP